MTVKQVYLNWQKVLSEKIFKVEPIKLGKSVNYFWVQPKRYILFDNDSFEKMREWCKDSLGYCCTNGPKFRFYFKTEADRTAFMIAWCFEKNTEPN